MLKPLPTTPHFPTLEEEVLEYWKNNKIFEESVASRPEDKKWTFLDGPPFVTGMPHYGTLLSSIPKDLFGRYWTMKGYRVRRVWGWDGHGLPIENKVEKALSVKRKIEIETIVGIDKFVTECKKYVNDVSAEWEWYVDHIARWVDFENAYKTWDTPYMESVMWVFKQMYDKNLIYKGLRVSLYCPHCATPISNFEVAMDADNYKNVTEIATTYKYKLKGSENTYFLAWSTTPWTKLVTTALAINPEFVYVTVVQNNEKYILAKARLEMIAAPTGVQETGGEYQIEKEQKGSELVGTEYEPHFDFYTVEEGKKVNVIVGADYVSEEDGTGIVTLAAYGQEDLAVMKAQNIQTAIHLDDEGTIMSNVPEFGGMYYLKANKLIDANLENRNLIYHNTKLTHKMPHCWRCATQLYYSPQNAWYVDVQRLKPDMKKINEDVNWYPNHFKKGRFQKSMDAAPDWCISRNRYWGSPVPVWECECGERFVPESIADLENVSGSKVTDMHRPGIDNVKIKCAKCGKVASRVPEVLDSWIEAGSASFAERHFPFDQTQKLDDFFPPDFIVEYTGQIRAWFYVLHVIATALYDKQAFKNVVVTGVILGSDGLKMSKNLGNYPDPKLMLQKYGGDALRLYLMGSPVMKGEDIVISEVDYGRQIKTFHLPVWNIINYLITYSGSKEYQFDIVASREKAYNSTNILDRWVLTLLDQLMSNYLKALDAYDTTNSVKLLEDFVDDVSRWYVRRSRDRVDGEDTQDEEAFFQTLYTVITSFLTLSAPIAPFISEYLFRHLTDKKSVHLELLGESSNKIDEPLLSDMATVRSIVEVGHRVRKDLGIKLRQTLRSATLKVPESIQFKSQENETGYTGVLKGELNVQSVEILTGNVAEIEVLFDTVLTPELQAIGEAREIVRTIQQERKRLGLKNDELVKISVVSLPDGQEDYIKKSVGASVIEIGTELRIVS